MKIKLFLIQLKKAMEKTFPTLTVDFFVSWRNRYVHMGLNRPLHSIENFVEVLPFIENLWSEIKNKDDFFICCRYLEIVHWEKHSIKYCYHSEETNCQIFLLLRKNQCQMLLLLRKRQGQMLLPLRKKPVPDIAIPEKKQYQILIPLRKKQYHILLSLRQKTVSNIAITAKKNSIKYSYYSRKTVIKYCCDWEKKQCQIFLSLRKK